MIYIFFNRKSKTLDILLDSHVHFSEAAGVARGMAVSVCRTTTSVQTGWIGWNFYHEALWFWWSSSIIRFPQRLYTLFTYRLRRLAQGQHHPDICWRHQSHWSDNLGSWNGMQERGGKSEDLVWQTLKTGSCKYGWIDSTLISDIGPILTQIAVLGLGDNRAGLWSYSIYFRQVHKPHSNLKQCSSAGSARELYLVTT